MIFVGLRLAQSHSERIIMIWICIAIVLGVVGLDQLTKWLVMLNMELHESVPIIKDILHLTYVRNPGAAMGILKDNRWVFIVLSLVGVAAVFFYLFRYRPKQWYVYVPLSMIAGGGVGNMIDRLFYGESFGNGTVVDFIDFCAFPNLWMWIFNVADIFVCVGAGALFVYLVIDIINDFKKEKAKKDGQRDV